MNFDMKKFYVILLFSVVLFASVSATWATDINNDLDDVDILSNDLEKIGANVIMTKNATEFITPLTFETLTNNRCVVDTFDRNFKYDVEHISLAKQADLMLIAPATANVIAKMAHGIAVYDFSSCAVKSDFLRVS